jgi:hypothetical protein
MLSDLELATVADGDVLRGLARLAAIRLNLLNNIHALNDGAEDNMTVVQPRGLHGGDEELRSIGVGTGVSHRHDSWSGVLQGEVLILEFVSVDGLASSAVVVGEVSALAHEVGDDAVECGALVAVALLAGAQSAEVFASLWNDIGAKLKRIKRDNFRIKSWR